MEWLQRLLANKGSILSSTSTKATLRIKLKNMASTITRCKSMVNRCVVEHRHHRRCSSAEKCQPQLQPKRRRLRHHQRRHRLKQRRWPVKRKWRP